MLNEVAALPRAGSRRVLLIDAHKSSCVVLSYALRLRGHECIWVSTLDDAFAVIPRFRPDVIAYEWAFRRDLVLGACSRLRVAAASIGQSIRVMAVSVREEPDGFSLSEGLDGYFVKPLELSAFESLLW